MFKEWKRNGIIKAIGIIKEVEYEGSDLEDGEENQQKAKGEICKGENQRGGTLEA